MSSQMQEAECALFSEIKCLREKVYDLQRFKMLSKSENLELQSLREKMKEINERKRMQSTLDGIPDRKYRTWHPDHTVYFHLNKTFNSLLNLIYNYINY